MPIQFHLSPRARDRLKTWQGEALLAGLALLGGMSRLFAQRRAYQALLVRLVNKTRLFDRTYYLEQNVDVATDGMRPLRHYVSYGDLEGRSPMPLFDPAYYRAHAAGCTNKTISLLHYVYIGRYRRISPSPWFDVNLYLTNNKDVWRSGIDPLRHYLEWGGREGRSPNAQFDGAYYLRAHPDVLEAGLNPLLHYIRYGRQEGRLAVDVGNEVHAEAEVTVPPPAWDTPVPTDWAKLKVRRSRGKKPIAVDVIIPVYRNRALTLCCLSSALAARNKTRHELVVINDASPEPELRADLAEMARRGWIRLIENDTNLGFVATVNRGLALHRERDVVLLNSDTEVYDDWLDRLRQAAYRTEKVASVTPLSNNATICSYPRFLHDNPYPLEIDYSTLDRLAAQINAGVTVETPTGVGFCMYMRRAAIEAVGRLDEMTFGKGYGEENDWCQRAIEHGWHNLISADTFVRHFGGASFQGEKSKRMASALQIMASQHPTYDGQVQHFINTDPLHAARRALDWARLNLRVRKKNVLLVCHNRGGGAERHLQEDAQRLHEEGQGVFFLRPVRGRPSHVRLQNPRCRELPNLSTFRLADTDALASVLRTFGITRVHSHGLVDFEPESAEHLLRLAQALEVPLHVDIHDYKVICPRLSLADRNGYYCGEKGDNACNVCLRREDNDFRVYDIRLWRQMHNRVLRAAERICVPDIDVAERLRRYYPDLSYKVLPHETIKFQPRMRSLRPGERLRVITIGAIGKIKGYDVLLACAQDVKKRRLPIDFILMGYSMNDSLLQQAGVQITGKYQEHEARDKLTALDPHVAFLPTLCPETYSYTLSLALELGLPVLGFDIGAIATRLRALDWTHGLMSLERAGNPREINMSLLSLLSRTVAPAQTKARRDKRHSGPVAPGPETRERVSNQSESSKTNHSVASPKSR